MIELERIDESNRSIYNEYEKLFNNNLNKYQSRIFPDFRCEIVQWFHIKMGIEYIGAIWLEQKTEDDFAVLGIFIADNKFRNKGYGSQAIEKIKEVCLPYMSVDKILLHVRANNQRAVNCYIKCGFKESRRYVTSNKIEVIEMIYHHLPQRKRLRLEGYDYSQNGSYFVTVVTKRRMPLLCKIVREGLCALPKIKLTKIGSEVKNSIEYINNYQYVSVDKYAIMPDHIHLLISLNFPGGHGDPPLQDIVAHLKSYTTHKHGEVLWQRSYFDHIIRDEEDYLNVWNYIDANSIKHTAD